MVLDVDELPRPGQTVLGRNFQSFAGGKGANQAVAARRAGGEVCFVAAVGNDDPGRQAIATLNAEGIDVTKLLILDDTPSGVALIFVSGSGENCIAVAPGANSALSAGYLQENRDLFASAGIVLLQLETPLETVAAAVELARHFEIPCVLNPAPAAELPDSILGALFCITPNQHEAEVLTGIAVADPDNAARAANVLLQRGVSTWSIPLALATRLMACLLQCSQAVLQCATRSQKRLARRHYPFRHGELSPASRT